jgi:hypothetical protein
MHGCATFAGVPAGFQIPATIFITMDVQGLLPEASDALTYYLDLSRKLRSHDPAWTVSMPYSEPGR